MTVQSRASGMDRIRLTGERQFFLQSITLTLKPIGASEVIALLAEAIYLIW
jgi:hypothetical protein